MKLELIKKDKTVIGYKLIAETRNDKLQLGSIRNMEFFGLNEDVLKYNGVKSEGNYAIELSWIQAKHQK